MVLEVGSELLLEIVERNQLILDNDGDLELLDSVSDGNCRGRDVSPVRAGGETKDKD